MVYLIQIKPITYTDFFPNTNYLETNEHESKNIQKLWHEMKAALIGKSTAIQSYLRKQEKSQINNLPLHPKLLEKEEQVTLKVHRRKVIKDQSRNK